MGPYGPYPPQQYSPQYPTHYAPQQQQRGGQFYTGSSAGSSFAPSDGRCGGDSPHSPPPPSINGASAPPYQPQGPWATK